MWYSLADMCQHFKQICGLPHQGRRVRIARKGCPHNGEERIGTELQKSQQQAVALKGLKEVSFLILASFHLIKTALH
jgi:hypothetical protein